MTSYMGSNTTGLFYELTRGGTIRKHRPGGGQARGGSKPKLLPTLVAKWLERWQTCSVSLRTALMFDQKLESDHG